MKKYIKSFKYILWLENALNKLTYLKGVLLISCKEGLSVVISQLYLQKLLWSWFEGIYTLVC